MKSLLILRHAKSSWKHPHLSDHARPLNKRGQVAAPRMGQLMYEEDLVPDIILCSTARRAVETTEIIAEASGFGGEIIYHDDLYHGWPSDYVDTLRSLSDDVDRAMVVGHNPGLEGLLELLTDEIERLPTAALALIQLPVEQWHQLTDEVEGKLIGIWYPRDLIN